MTQVCDLGRAPLGLGMQRGVALVLLAGSERTDADRIPRPFTAASSTCARWIRE